MESHAVPVDVLCALKRKRRADYSAEQISTAVTEARHSGAHAAAAKLNRGLSSADSIPEDTIRKWLSRWKKEGAFWEIEKKRGRNNLLDTLPEPVRTEWTKQVTAVRMQGESVTGRVAAALGRGIMAEKTPSLLERHGGDLKMSISTGQRMLHKEQMSFRKRTSARVIPPTSDL